MCKLLQNAVQGENQSPENQAAEVEPANPERSPQFDAIVMHKAVSIIDNQDNEELKSMSLSRMSNRKTEATIGKLSSNFKNRDSALSAFFSDEEEIEVQDEPNNFQRNPHLSNPTKNIQNNANQKTRKMNSLKKTPKSQVICMEDLIFGEQDLGTVSLKQTVSEGLNLNQQEPIFNRVIEETLQPEIIEENKFENKFLGTILPLTQENIDFPHLQPIKEELREIKANMPHIKRGSSIEDKTQSNSSESSSDDPDIIKPSGIRFTIEVGVAESEIKGEDKKVVGGKKVKEISFMEAWLRIKTMDLSRDQLRIQEMRKAFHQKQTIMSKLFTYCSISQNHLHLTNGNLIAERDQIIAFSNLHFDMSNQLHIRIVSTLYCQFRNTGHCPLIGHHWLSIGFRHCSPKYNFTGIFGAVQILAFLFCYKDYMLDVLDYIDILDKCNEDIKHSQIQKNTHDQQQISNNQSTVSCNQTLFPINLRSKQKEISLCVILQDISQYVLQWLERGKLNTIINAEKSVIGVVNKVFFATFFIFFEKFKKENSGFLSMSIAFKATIDYVNDHPSEALQLFKMEISNYYKHRE